MKLFSRVAALAALTMFVLVPTAAQADPSFYETPLFGIATVSGNTLLVADSGQGIVNADTGALVAPLPAVTDVAARAGGGLWATTGGMAGPWKLFRVDGGVATGVADLGEFEERHNPHPFVVESNPTSVADAGGGAAVVVDAAGNTLLHVSGDNSPNSDVSSRVKLVAILPNEGPLESVPTSVAVGPDGAYYVGELKGAPGPVGESRVWRIEPNARNADCGDSHKCSVVLDGLTSIIDLTFGPDGQLYVAQFDDAGWLAAELGSGVGGSVQECNLATGACAPVVTGIPLLTSIAFRGNVIWGTILALVPGAADVVPLATP